MLAKKPLIISTDNKKRKTIVLVSLACLIILLGTLSALELTNTTYFFHEEATAPTASQSTKGEISSGTPGATSTSDKIQPSANSSPGGSNNSQDKDSGNTGASTTILIVPSGNFVSAHRVPLSAGIASVCNTTPGATCKISFTSNGVTKSLVAQTTDKGGATYWNSWTPASIGLTAGSWQIQAIATSGNQTQTATDALALEVAQ